MVLFNIIRANQTAAMAPSPPLDQPSLYCATTFPEDFTHLKRKKEKERKGIIETMNVDHFSFDVLNEPKGVEF